jgi:hypothetical protein
VPVVGTLPPTKNDLQGNPKGFWSVTVYQPDASESAAPFLPQTSVLNTAYSAANIDVTAVDPSAGTIRVKPSAWDSLIKSMPIMFGPTAAQYGLTPGQPYYVASTPTSAIDSTPKRRTYTFTLSTEWKQKLSKDDVPIQDSGKPVGPVQLTNPGGPVNLQWGPVQPVSQLGSQQLASGKLVRNLDNSVTIWLAPSLPMGAPPTNWIPTPSTSYYSNIYSGSLSTSIGR